MAVSPSVSGGAVLLTFVGFTLLYGALMVADVHLLVKYAKSASGSLAEALSSAGAD